LRIKRTSGVLADGLDFEPSDFSQGSYLSIGIKLALVRKGLLVVRRRGPGDRVRRVRIRRAVRAGGGAPGDACRSRGDPLPRPLPDRRPRRPPLRRAAGWWLGLLGALPRRRAARAARAPLARRQALPPLLRGSPRQRTRARRRASRCRFTCYAISIRRRAADTTRRSELDRPVMVARSPWTVTGTFSRRRSRFCVGAR
jgi:hypothetical protein